MKFEKDKEGKLIGVEISIDELERLDDDKFCDFIIAYVELVKGNVIEYINKRIFKVVKESNENVKKIPTGLFQAINSIIERIDGDGSSLNLIDFDNIDISYAALALIGMIKVHNGKRGIKQDEDTIIFVKRIQESIKELIKNEIFELEY